MNPADFTLQPCDVPQPQLLDADPVDATPWPMLPGGPVVFAAKPSLWERMLDAVREPFEVTL